MNANPSLNIDPAHIGSESLQGLIARKEPAIAAIVINPHQPYDWPTAPWPATPRGGLPQVLPRPEFFPREDQFPGIPVIPFKQAAPARAGRPQDEALKAAVATFLSGEENGGEKRTHFILLLDKSGSMINGKDITIAGFNQQLDVIEAAGAQAGHTTITLMTFDGSVFCLQRAREPGGVEKLTPLSYLPNGGTALFDATAAALEMAMGLPGAASRNTAFNITVLTDGAEQHSKHVSGPCVGGCVESLKKTGRFTFSLMGPKEHLTTLADILNVDKGNVDGFDPSSLSSRASSMSAMVGATQTYLQSRAAGQMSASNLYSSNG